MFITKNKDYNIPITSTKRSENRLKLATVIKETISPLEGVIETKFTTMLEIGATFMINTFEKELNQYMKKKEISHRFGSVKNKKQHHILLRDVIRPINFKKHCPELNFKRIILTAFKAHLDLAGLKHILLMLCVWITMICLRIFISRRSIIMS